MVSKLKLCTKNKLETELIITKIKSYFTRTTPQTNVII